MDLYYSIYAFQSLQSAQKTIESLDPMVQFGLAAGILAYVTGGNLLGLVAGLALVVFLRLKYIELSDASQTNAGVASTTGDASSLTNDVLMSELKTLDPAGKLEFLWFMPEVFHVFFQVVVLKQMAPKAFQRALDAADHYVELSMEMKKVENLPDAAKRLSTAIDRAALVVDELQSVGYEVPMIKDKELSWRHRDAVKTLRIVLRRDLDVLRTIAVRSTQKSERSFDVVPKLDEPRPSDAKPVILPYE